MQRAAGKISQSRRYKVLAKGNASRGEKPIIEYKLRDAELNRQEKGGLSPEPIFSIRTPHKILDMITT
jgi:hypothetical protein